MQRLLMSCLACSALCTVPTWAAEPSERRIEEIVVTAERRESTVSDTSISITAFTGEFLEDFGIRNQEDLQNYIPAAVIEPYDITIRGVGRNFRSLGGDPGVATYLNGVYSEDFGIASTEGGLYDIERIEVLRGPQGTLYGRNAIGGAINFINAKPTDEVEGELRTVLGDNNLKEFYGMVSGPLIQDVLSARATGSKRTRDGYVEELGPFGNDPDDYGDENYTLALRFTPTERIEFNVRGNERSYARRMGGATAAGIVNFTENGGRPDEITGGARNTSTLAWGYRGIDRTVTDPLASNFFNPGQALFNFTDPVTGAAVEAQRIRPGIEASVTELPNYAFGHNQGLASRTFLGLGDIDGNDLETDTNGLQSEFFDHQAVAFDANWVVNDWLTVKYIFGYTDYFYDRRTDDDLTSNTFADRQFYVSQENENWSHELQLFYDIGNNLSFTTGFFTYDARINQRGDFFDSTGNSRLRDVPDYGGLAPGIDFMIQFIGLGDGTPATLFSAKEFAKASGAPEETIVLRQSLWQGDTGTRIHSGPRTIATDLEYGTRSKRDATAIYTQGEWQISDRWELTAGLRWARDELEGEENLFLYDEEIVDYIGLANLFGLTSGLNLGRYNVATGALAGDANGDPLLDANNLPILTGNETVRLAGIPVASSLFRELERADEEFTWRINIDYEPNDDTLLYLSATTGYRAGGFNLVFFSFSPQFEPEELTSYELGYKGKLLENRLQLNAAIYYYDYDNIHTFAQGPNATGGISTSVFAAPGAEVFGVDADALWLATDHLTLGLNVSYTPSEYTKDLFLIDQNDPNRPESLFAAGDLPLNIEGNQLLRVPEAKAGGFAQYDLRLGDLGKLQFITSLSWIDEVYFSAFESDVDRSPSYYRWDGRVNWTSAAEDWEVALFVNNITDEIGIRQIDRTDETENFRRSGATTFPRQFGLEVRYRFDAFQ